MMVRKGRNMLLTYGNVIHCCVTRQNDCLLVVILFFGCRIQLQHIYVANILWFVYNHHKTKSKATGFTRKTRSLTGF